MMISSANEIKAKEHLRCKQTCFVGVVVVEASVAEIVVEVVVVEVWQEGAMIGPVWTFD